MRGAAEDASADTIRISRLIDCARGRVRNRSRIRALAALVFARCGATKDGDDKADLLRFGCAVAKFAVP